MKNAVKLIILFVSITICNGCAFDNGGNSGKDSGSSKRAAVVSVACWNAQTFFDAEVDGTEYSDFKNYTKWSREKYLMRLGRLCQVMTALNADVFVLEEIENEAVVQDIANQLAGKAWSKKNNWNYATFAKIEGASIGCAVFSKYPLENGRVHCLDIRTQKDEQPQSRPILQVCVDVDGRNLNVVANHWKSKSGGEEETEIWREWQELVCQNAIEKIDFYDREGAIVVCGDFNRDAADFITDFSEHKGNFNTVFRGAQGNSRLNNTWFNKVGVAANEKGSYFFQGQWERIDNIFVHGEVQVSAFAPKYQGDWADVNGIPKGYKIYSGEGFSDHLPLMCYLEF